MSVDKLVDSTQLDADLTSVANAIRTKGGTSAQLAFPAGFVSAINDISGGGGTDRLPEAMQGEITEYENSDVTSLKLFRTLERLSLSNATVIEGQYSGGSAANMNYSLFKSLKTLFAPKANINTYGAFSFLPNLEIAVIKGTQTSSIQSAFRGCTKLATADISGASIAGPYFFTGCTILNTIILRRSGIVATGGAIGSGTFTSTPFANNGAGGTIYIPKALYDHLGDGTSLDYKAATNWVTIDGYGTITWAKIEGSIYETQYADGTPIS